MLGLGNLLTKSGVIKKFPNDFSFNFDGSNDYLELPITSALNITGAMTVSGWFKVSSQSSAQFIICKDDTSNRVFNVAVLESSSGNANKLIFNIYNGGSATSVLTAGTVTDNNWHHFAGVFVPSTSLTLYIDGTASTNTTSIPSSIDMSTDEGNTPIRIGNHEGNALYTNGLIDEIAIWDSALDATAIGKISSKVVDLTKYSASNLKLWLRAGDKVLPEEDASIARSDFYTDFDGTNDYVNIADNDALSFGDGSNDLPFSGTAWINPVDATNFQIAFKDTEWQFYLNSSDKLALFFEDESSGAYEYAVDSGSAISQNVWTHVAFTYNGVGGASANAGMKLYVNGIESSYTLGDSGTYVAMENSANAVTIGKQGSNYSDGKISNVAIHKTALDAQTIKQFAKSRYTPMRDNRFSVVDFDGTNDYIEIANSDSMNIGTSDATISAWLNVTDTGANEYIFSKIHSDIGYYVAWHNSEKILFYIKDGSGNDYYSYADQTLSYGIWYHYAVSWNSTTNKATHYIDGVQVGVANEDDGTVGDVTNTGIAKIGGDSGSASYDFKGSISSVSLYNVAKSADEVYALYSKGITYNESSESGLVGLWRMGDDTSKAFATIADSSSNSNDGTITNGASDDIVQQMVAGYDMGAFESSSEELGGDTLSGVGIFDTDTTSSWSAVNTSISYNSSGFMRSVFSGTNEGGAHAGAVLTIGNNYNVTFQAKSDRSVKISLVGYPNEFEEVTNPTLTTSFQQYEFNISPQTDALFRIYMASGGSADDFLDLKDIRLKEVLQSADLSDTHPLLVDVNNPVISQDLQTGNWNNNDPSSNGMQGFTGASADGFTAVNGTAGAGNNDASYGDEISFTAGKTYKLSFTNTVNSGTMQNVLVGVTSGTGGSADNIMAYSLFYLAGNYSYTFIPTSTVTRRPSFRFIANGTYDFTISNFEIIEYNGNIGTMTNQDSADLVYSSVLPDQSFLTGVNSAYNFLDLDGGDQSINLDSFGFALDDYSTGAYSIWFYAHDQNPSTTQYVVSARDGETNTRVYVQLKSDGLRIAHGNTFNSSVSYSANQWNHILVSWSSGTVTVYLNGSQSSQFSFSTASGDNAFDFQLGGVYTADANFFDGYLGQFALWNKAQDSNISNINTLGRHGNLLDSYADNLKIYLGISALDAKTGLSDSTSTIYDRSGNSNHVTPTNADAGDLKSSPNAEPHGYAKGDTNRSTTTP